VEPSRYRPREERRQAPDGIKPWLARVKAAIGAQSREETMTTSQGLLLVMADIDPAIEHDFNQWYEQEHLAERMAIPGFLRARRFKAIEGSPKYLALYDLESPDVLNSADYRHVIGARKSAWTRRMEPQFRNFTRNVYVSISDRHL
jgi:hypothetical protein